MSVTAFPNYGKEVNFPGTGRVGIKSIQQGVIELTATEVDDSDTINEVDANYSICIFQGLMKLQTGHGEDERNARVELTDDTTVTAYRNTQTDDLGIHIGYVVIEFFPGNLKSIEQGTVTISNTNTTGTDTLSTAVSDSKSIVFYQGHIYDAANELHYNSTCRIALTDVVSSKWTKITATRSGSGSGLTAGYVVVEFY